MKEKMKWVSIDEAVAIVKSLHKLDWVMDFKLKYLKIYIDTRDKHCIILDRDDNILTQKQYDAYKSGEYLSYVKHFHNPNRG